MKKISVLVFCCAFCFCFLGANTLNNANSTNAQKESAKIAKLEKKLSNMKKKDEINNLENKLSKLEKKSPKKVTVKKENIVPKRRVFKEETLNRSVSKSSFRYFLGLDLGYASINDHYTAVNSANKLGGDISSGTASTYGLVGGLYYKDNHKFTITYNSYLTDDGFNIDSYSLKYDYLFRNKADIIRPYLGVGIGNTDYTVDGIKNYGIKNKIDLSSFGTMLDAGLEFDNLSLKNLSVDLGVRYMFLDGEKKYDTIDIKGDKLKSDFKLNDMTKGYVDISYIF